MEARRARGRLRWLLILVAAAGAVFGTTACDTVPAPPTTPSGTLSPKTSVTSIAISGAWPTVGTSSQLRATAKLANGAVADVTNDVRWQSTNPLLLFISATGLATGLATGPGQVSADLQGVTATHNLLVSGPGTYLMFVSEPGDPIGRGDVFFGTGVIGAVPTPDHVAVHYVLSWFLDLAAPGGLPLTVGTYENATAFPHGSSSGPRLVLYTRARPICIQIQGRFVVDEAVYSPGLERFHATFEQRCDGRPETLRGDVSINR